MLSKYSLVTAVAEIPLAFTDICSCRVPDPVKSSLSVSAPLLGLGENQGRDNSHVSSVQSASWHPHTCTQTHIPPLVETSPVPGALGSSQGSLSETGTRPSFIFPLPLSRLFQPKQISPCQQMPADYQAHHDIRHAKTSESGSSPTRHKSGHNKKKLVTNFYSSEVLLWMFLFQMSASAYLPFSIFILFTSVLFFLWVLIFKH